MARRLTGGAGTGKKIIEYWEGFSFQFREQEGDTLIFDISFYNQKGYFNIRMNDNQIESVTMDCGLYRPLGNYNDESLLDVAHRIVSFM